MTLYEYVRRNDRLDLLLEWDGAANRDLTPSTISPNSKRRVAWVCSRGHHYETALYSRTIHGTGCPYCARLKAIPGENDLATLKPELLELWDYERNGDPHGLLPGSRKKVWWKCKQGHSWRQTVYAVANGSGCPFCSGYYPIVGKTDLATTHPQLAAQWDSEKNKADATSVSAGSAVNVWWRCEKGHSFQAIVYSRMIGSGCPYCAGRKVLAGFNDLQTTDPELCREWDTEKNTIRPTEVNRGSHKKIWWRCELGHSYEAEVYARSVGNGCPYCAGRRVLPGFNDLSTTHPRVAAQWAQELNGSVTPEMVTKGCNKKYWWRCGEGHYWQAAVYSRTRKNASDCPICAGTARVKMEGRYRKESGARPGTVRERPQERPAV